MKVVNYLVKQKNLLFTGIVILSSTAIALPVLAESPKLVESNSQYLSNKAGDLLAQDNLTRVIGVEIIQTENGLELVLETLAKNQQLVPLIIPEGNNLVIDVLDATLALPTGNEFRESDPAPGISKISVVTAEDNSIRVTITGENQTPSAKVVPGGDNLVLSIAPEGATTTEEPAESIDVVVSATRTEENIQDVPRSVTVVTREEIEEQTKIVRDLQTILGNTVPGLGPTSESNQSFAQTLRGRSPLVLVDGIPISSVIDNDTSVGNLRRLDASAVERVEVVRGPSAVYGDGAAGGVINIITRIPQEEGIVSEAEIGVRSFGDLRGGSFGNFLDYRVSGKQGIFDFVTSFTYDTYGQPFDAEGDPVPVITESQGNSDSINFLGKFGFEITPKQRIQVTANYFNDEQEQNGELDPTVGEIPGIQKARLTDNEIQFVDSPDPFARGTIAALSYTHDDIFNSKLEALAYYRKTETADLLFDERPFDPDNLLEVNRSVVESERIGGRLQADTEILDNLSVLWGADYSNEDSEGIPEVFDPEEFDNSDRTIARRIGTAVRIPPFEIENFGVFSQLNWDATKRLALTGGIRYENIDVSVVDNWIDGDTGIAAEGGEQSLDDVVFNAGVIYKATSNISLFTNFAQGFSLPNISRVLQNPDEGFDFDEDIELTEPQTVDSYEIGVRGQWKNVQATLAAFYTYSELGTSLETVAIGEDLRVLRAPQRNYGVEMAVDWQASQKWQLGGTFTWIEGDLEDAETGEFLASTSYEVFPIKLTAYVENETLPGWKNRLQALYVGNRDRAFEDDIDPIGIDDYFLLDLISSLELGSGELSFSVRNLLNNQYFSVPNQVNAGFDDSFAIAARGRSFTLNYRFSF